MKCIWYTICMKSPDSSPQSEFNFEAKSIEELRSTYTSMVGIPPRFDIKDNADFLANVTASSEAAEAEHLRLVMLEREENADDSPYKRR